MIGYFTLGNSDIKRVAEFYDALLGEIGTMSGVPCHSRFMA